MANINVMICPHCLKSINPRIFQGSPGNQDIRQEPLSSSSHSFPVLANALPDTQLDQISDELQYRGERALHILRHHKIEVPLELLSKP